MAVLDFNSDTLGAAPTGLTAQGGSALVVVNNATFGSKTAELTQPGNFFGVATIDGFTTSTSWDVRFKTPTSGAEGYARGGFGFMHATAGGVAGYFIQFDSASAPNDIRFLKQTGTVTYEQIADETLPTTTDHKWRLTCSTNGTLTTIRLYSWNGSAYVLEYEWTDATYTSAGYCRLQTVSTFQVDDLEVIDGNAVLSITTPVANKCFQRISSAADVTVTGTTTASPGTVQYRIDGGSWATLDASPSGGSFSGTISVSTGEHTLDVRESNTPGTTASRDIAVGDVFLWFGQSNASGRGTNPQEVTANGSGTTAYVYHDGDGWKLANDPICDDTQDGSVVPLIATELLTSRNVPVAFICHGFGGTAIDNWTTGATHYNETVAAYTGAAPGAIKAAIFWQGESDAIAGTAQATYLAALQDIAAGLADDVTWANGVKLLVTKLGPVGLADPGDLTAIRAAQEESWADDTIYAGPDLSGLTFGDDLHAVSDAELQEVAALFAAAILALDPTTYTYIGLGNPLIRASR